MRTRKFVACVMAVTMLVGQCMSVSAVRSMNEINRDKNQKKDELQGLTAELQGIVSSIASLDAEIAEKQGEIKDAQEQLEEAQAAVEKQNADMRLRIQFMYENNNQSILSIFLESGNISDFLNKLEYIKAVNEHDRQQLDNYQALVNEVQDMKDELEAEKRELQAAESELAVEKQRLDSLVASKRSEIANIDKELKEAEARAREEERRRREEAQSANATQPNTSGNSSAGVTGDLNPGNVTGVSGEAVIAYANSFVGNKYTWGGHDPINGGADCSGFIYYVYKHFGINYGGRLTSYGLRSVGQEVSYNNLQLGDIVCYSGHVGLYAGGGRIVEAQDSAHGITNTRSVNCSRIITIRRVL